MVDGNPAVPKDCSCHKCSQTLKPQLQKCFPEEVSEPLCCSGLPPVQIHFRNPRSDFPGKCSCAIDCLLEVSCYIFKDAIAYVERNMYLLTEWEDRTGKYLARGQGVWTERSEVRSS